MSKMIENRCNIEDGSVEEKKTKALKKHSMQVVKRTMQVEECRRGQSQDAHRNLNLNIL